MNAGARRFGPVIVASVLIAAAQVARGPKTAVEVVKVASGGSSIPAVAERRG